MDKNFIPVPVKYNFKLYEYIKSQNYYNTIRVNKLEEKLCSNLYK